MLKKSKRVYQFDMKGNLIGEFASLSQAEKLTKTWQPNITKCCRGYLKSANGFQWSYKNTLPLTK